MPALKKSLKAASVCSTVCGRLENNMSHIAERGLLSRTWIGWLSVLGFILTIPLSNWVVVNVGVVCDPTGPCLIPVWPGIMSPSAVLVAGFALVLRDSVHHFLGARWALYSIVFGAALSGFFSEPSLVAASVAAFLFSEFADFCVYAPLRERHHAFAIMVSGLIGSVVDSAIFLWLAFGSLDYVFGQVLGKFWVSLIASAIVVAWRRMHTPAAVRIAH